VRVKLGANRNEMGETPVLGKAFETLAYLYDIAINVADSLSRKGKKAIDTTEGPSIVDAATVQINVEKSRFAIVQQNQRLDISTTRRSRGHCSPEASPSSSRPTIVLIGSISGRQLAKATFQQRQRRPVVQENAECPLAHF
jgi:hypothetical protein